MGKTRILITFVGNHDPWPDFGISGPVGERQNGPVLSLLYERDYDEVILLCTGSDYFERARQIAREREQDSPSPRFSPMMVTVPDVIDYHGIFAVVSGAMAALGERYSHRDPEWSILLDPGTPQMQTVLVLLARSGPFPATLLQGIPPRFNDGVYAVREVDFPEALGKAIPPTEIPAFLAEEQDAGAEPSFSDLQQNRVKSPLESPREGGIDEDFDVRMAADLEESGVICEDQEVWGTFRLARLIADHDDVVPLILGETGTGKTLLARWIHDSSGRKNAPFVDINCATIHRETAESQLFGHVKGAFSGAESDRPGFLRAAEGGTLFLDEIGELPPDIQAKLLHVIEGGPFRPMGSDSAEKADVRIIVATNRDLETDVREGRFRQDLYHRIEGIRLEFPALRDRPKDLAILLDTTLNQWNQKRGASKEFDDAARDLLLSYPWPGNIRELENAVATSAVLCQEDTIGAEYLPGKITGDGGGSGGSVVDAPRLPAKGLNIGPYLVAIEKSLYAQALERAGGNGEKAAALLGLKGATFRKALRERHADLGSGGAEKG